MFGRITPEDKLRERIEAKRIELLNSELIAMEVPYLRKQLEHLEKQLKPVEPITEVTSIFSGIRRRIGGPQAPVKGVKRLT